MNKLNSVYINALLADAAYVEDLATLTGGALADALETRMTKPVANFIGNNFEVITQQETGDIIIISSGFDATVWRGKANTDYDGQVYLSMRGTEPGSIIGGDGLADVDLAFNSAARKQIGDMVNWWLRASAPVGEMAKQIAYVELPTNYLPNFFITGNEVEGTGELADVTSVYINGHSLGGHLASAFARIFGGSVNISGIDTFNSAGFLATSELVFINMAWALGISDGDFYAGQNNYFAENGINITTNDWYHNQIGEKQEIFNKQAAWKYWH
ncbi:hypothetical protein [Stenoxybacter acetivorans]|uniref:hypothetical protein n=1 Tax=Stenoxybacter acetivorans TaxID=422441 RepID=UPI00056B05EA|nr:hypothetical protein [Stenoxybacter acetivorans]